MENKNPTIKNEKEYSEILKSKLEIIKEKYIKIEGTLYDYSKINSGESIFYAGKYEYFVDEKRYTYENTLLEPNQGAKGNVSKNATLYYNPENPEEAYSEESMKRCLDYHPIRDGLVITIGLIIILVIFVFIIRLLVK